MTRSHRSPSVANRRFFLRETGVSLALPLYEFLGGRVFAEVSAVGSLAGMTPDATVFVITLIFTSRESFIGGDGSQKGDQGGSQNEHFGSQKGDHLSPFLLV